MRRRKKWIPLSIEVEAISKTKAIQAALLCLNSKQRKYFRNRYNSHDIKVYESKRIAHSSSLRVIMEI